jgi:hypothetical protein
MWSAAACRGAPIPRNVSSSSIRSELGLQFAAVAKHILSAAEKQKMGERLPTAWFTEDMHP